MAVKLSELLATSQAQKTQEVIYDKDWNVKLKMVYLSRSELQAIIGRNTKIEFDRKSHQKEDKLDHEGFLKEVLETCVVGWSGVTYKWLMTQVLLDKTKIKNIEEELEFSQENLQTLCKFGFGLDTWIMDIVRDATNFSDKVENEIKN